MLLDGVGVYDYASSGDVQSQIYLCPTQPCLDRGAPIGKCQTFISALVVKTPKHVLVLRGNKVYADGSENGKNGTFDVPMSTEEMTVTSVGNHAGKLANAKRPADGWTTPIIKKGHCHPNLKREKGWPWKDCTPLGFTINTPTMTMKVGVVGPYKKGYLAEEGSDRTFNIDVAGLNDLENVTGVLNGDVNGAFKHAHGDEDSEVATNKKDKNKKDKHGIANVLQVHGHHKHKTKHVTAANVPEDEVLFPTSVLREMDAACKADN